MSNLTKTSPNQNSSNFDRFILSESSEEASYYSIQLTVSKKYTISGFMSSSNKKRPSPLESLSPKDMHMFQTFTHKEKFLPFNNRSIISILVINLSHLEESHYNIDHILKAQDMSMMFRLCGLKVFLDPIHIFLTNLCLSPNNREL